MNEKKLTIEEKLNIIKNCTDEDLELLTEKQIIIARKIKEGVQIRDITEMLGCSRQNVHEKIESIARKILNKNIGGKKQPPKKLRQIEKKAKKPRQIKVFDFGQFSDFSALSKQEKQVVLIHIQNPELTYREIGETLGLSTNTISTILCKAKKKLLGKWDDQKAYHVEYSKEYHRKNRDKCNAWSKAYYEKNKEKLIEDMRVYNKEYYKKNRERIIKNQKAYVEKNKKRNVNDDN